jgi:hypothetical protein
LFQVGWLLMQLQHPQECAGAARHYWGIFTGGSLHPLIQFPNFFACTAVREAEPVRCWLAGLDTWESEFSSFIFNTYKLA